MADEGVEFGVVAGPVGELEVGVRLHTTGIGRIISEADRERQMIGDELRLSDPIDCKSQVGRTETHIWGCRLNTSTGSLRRDTCGVIQIQNTEVGTLNGVGQKIAAIIADRRVPGFVMSVPVSEYEAVTAEVMMVEKSIDVGSVAARTVGGRSGRTVDVDDRGRDVVDGRGDSL